jgi:putative endonuclease
MEKQYYVYLLSNYTNTVIYTGVTNNLVKRIYQHKNKLIKGFTEKYNVTKLVYFEVCNTPYEAITREKQIKAGSRKKKIDLIYTKNPTWRDLFDEIAS